MFLLCRLMILLYLCYSSAQVLAIDIRSLGRFDSSIDWQPFFKAVEENDVETARSFLADNHIVISLRNTFGTNLFSFAKTAEMARMFLDHKIHPGIIDRDQNTFLHKADNAEIVRVLLDYEIDMNARNDHGMTPLHTVREIEVIRVLLNHGARVNAVDKLGRTPLAVHVMHLLINFINGSITKEDTNRLGIIELLMKSGATIRIKTVDQKTDIVLFAERVSQIRSDDLSLRHLETVRQLVKNEVSEELSEDVMKKLDVRITEERQRSSGGSNGGGCSKGFE